MNQFEQPDNKYGPLDQAVKRSGIITGVCQYCAGAFQATQAAEQAGLPLLGEASGHPSLAKLIREGYTPIVL